MENIDVFTDGACRGNPGPGGWGALLRWNGLEKKLKGAEKLTTNNRMEMMAAIQALRSLKRSCCVNLTTDSQYLRKGMTEWLANWKRNNWRNSQKKPVKNQDLWKELDIEVGRHKVSWHWVKGHSGHAENELVDELANIAIDELEL
jgi:ribonuclease HI